MKKNKIYYILITVVILFGLYSNGFSANNALPYLRMGVGSKALAMGSAFTAVADNITATYWNPAGVEKTSCIEIGTMYSANLGLDREHNYMGISRCFNFGTFAISWINAGWRDFPGDAGSGSYDIMDNNITLSYSKNILKGLNIGVNTKAYTQPILDETENGFGFDAGILYSMHEQIDIGFMARDFVSSFGDDEIPYQANIGLAVKPFNFYSEKFHFANGFTMAADAKKKQDDSDIKVNLGLEYALDFKEISKLDITTALRGGSNDGNLTAGFGIVFKMLEFNYAFTTDTSEDQIFKDAHRISLLMRF